MIALAEGKNLGGSLRVPAAYCGVVGLRPSVGRVPTVPWADPWDDLQVTGPIARRAADLQIALAAIEGPATGWPHAAPPGAAGDDRRRPGRIAWVPDIAGYGNDAAVLEACEQALGRLADAGFEIERPELDFSYGCEVFRVLRGMWMVRVHHRLLDRLDRLGDNLRGNIEYGLGLAPEAVGAAIRDRAKLTRTLEDLLGRCQAVLTPTVAVERFAVEEPYPTHIGTREMASYIDWVATTFLTSLTGLPAASVPCGLSENGFPVGLQIIGPRWQDDLVIDLAEAVEDASPTPALWEVGTANT
jgi:amidase